MGLRVCHGRSQQRHALRRSAGRRVAPRAPRFRPPHSHRDRRCDADKSARGQPRHAATSPTARSISAHFHWRKSVPHPVTEYHFHGDLHPCICSCFRKPLSPTRTQRLRALAELPFEAQFRAVVPVPVYQRIAATAAGMNHQGVKGESVTIAGALTTTERADFTVACAAWNRHGAGDDDGIFECASIAGNRFSISYRFTDGDVGRHTLRIFLYFRNSGSQFPRSAVSGITVAGQSAAQSGAPVRRARTLTAERPAPPEMPLRGMARGVSPTAKSGLGRDRMSRFGTGTGC